ncbi:hypothetical protein SAMD00019534_009640, partial [Acytostelium subglobosum LB1]|uniref:hypothetical protein n=1 Tax=Acytostelium subglobosum LB1 TaxID=1410327 RepID=UPI0006448617
MESEYIDLALDYWYVLIPTIMLMGVASYCLCSGGSNVSPKPKKKKTTTQHDQQQQQQKTSNNSIKKNRHDEPKDHPTSPTLSNVHQQSPLFEKSVKAMTTAGSPITAIAISPDGQQLAYSSDQRHIKIVNVESMFTTNPKSYNVQLPFDYARLIAWRNKQLYATLEDKLICYRLLDQKNTDGKTYEKLWDVPLQHKTPIVTLCSVSNGNHMISCGDDTTVKIWGLNNGESLMTINTGQIKQYMAAMSGNGRFFGVASFNSEVKIWEVINKKDGTFEKCQRVMSLTGYRTSIFGLAFNQEGNRVVSCSKDGTIKMWNLDVRYQVSEDPKCLYTLSCDLSCPPTIISYAPDGGVFVVGNQDFLQMRDANNGAILATISRDHSIALNNNLLAWTPDSHRLIIGEDTHFIIYRNPKHNK